MNVERYVNGLLEKVMNLEDVLQFVIHPVEKNFVKRYETI